MIGHRLCYSTHSAGVPEDGGHPNPHTLLREQTRRYNNLRVAYESLCRRVDKGRDVGGGKIGRTTGHRLGRASQPRGPSCSSGEGGRKLQYVAAETRMSLRQQS
ncbi:unnamed protein product [Hapterophycus canaliculatus]